MIIVGKQHSPFVIKWLWNDCENGVEPHCYANCGRPCDVVSLRVSSDKSHETRDSYFIMQRWNADYAFVALESDLFWCTDSWNNDPLKC